MARLVDIILNVSGRLDGIKQSIKGTADFEGRWERMTKRVRASAQAMARRVKQAMAVIGAAVVAGSVQATKSAADFDKSMRSVFTLLPGASKEMREELIKGAKEFSKEYGLPLEESVSAMYDAISAGVPPDNVLEFMGEAAKGAIAGVTDIKTTVNGLTAVLNAYKEQGLTAREASDNLFTTMRLGKTSLAELATNIGNVAPLASSLGVGFDEVAAAMAALTARLGNTSTATTQLRGLFAELARESGKAGQSFEKATGKTFPQFIREGGKVVDGIAAMRDYAASTGTEFLDLFSSIEAAQGGINLASELFANASKEMADSAGATAAAYAEMEQSISIRVQKLMNRFKVMGISIGEALLPGVEAMEAIFSGREIPESTMTAVKMLGLRLLKAAGSFTAHLIDKGTGFLRALGPAIGTALYEIGTNLGTVFDIVVNRLQTGILKATKLLFDQINKISDSSVGKFLGLGRLDTSALDRTLANYDKEFKELGEKMNLDGIIEDIAKDFKRTMFEETPVADWTNEFYDKAISKQERLLKRQQEAEEKARAEELKNQKEAALKMREALRQGGDQAGETIKQNMVDAANQSTEQTEQSLVPDGGRMERYRDAAGREQTRIFDASGRIIRDRGEQTVAGGLTSLSPIAPASAVVSSVMPTPATSTATRDQQAGQSSSRQGKGEISSAGDSVAEAVEEVKAEAMEAFSKIRTSLKNLAAQIKDQRNG